MIITRRVEDTTLNVHVDDIQFEKIQRKSRKYKKHIRIDIWPVNDINILLICLLLYAKI